MARALEIELGFDDPVAYVRAFGLAIPGAKPSMLLDLEAGRPTEVDFINGAIPRAGVGVGVAGAVQRGRQRTRACSRAGHPRLRAGRAPRCPGRRPRDAETGPSGRLRFPRDGGGAGRGRRVAARRANGRPADAAGGDVAPAGRAGRAGRLRRGAFDDPAFHRMLDTYGGLAAQIVTPIFGDGRLEAIVSVHAARRAAGLERRRTRRRAAWPPTGWGSCSDAQPLASAIWSRSRRSPPVRRSGSRPRTASTASSPARAPTPTPARSTSGSAIR